MGSPLRVLHVVVNMNRGGAETFIINLYRNVDRREVQFDFLTCKEGTFDSEIREMGGIVHRIPYISDVGHSQYIKELHSFFTANNHYKIVHSHMDKMGGIVLRAAKKAGIPIRISHSHNTRSEGGLAARIYKWYAGKSITPNATHLLACSTEAAKWLFHKKYPVTKIVKNGIDEEKFRFSPVIRNQVREELGISQHTFVIGHVGRFNYQKNHTFLIDLFSQFHKVEEDSKLILVGDGPLRGEMEKKISELHLQNHVHFLGIRSDIHRLLQAFDLFLFPSLHEGLPVSLIEAQGAGLPCLISDHISQEVDMGMNLVRYASLKNGEDWVEKMKALKVRQVNRSQVFNDDYNIKRSVNDLEKFYLATVR
ncbi:glycosyltransferase family 1 protein [Heyndrickxia sp. NPDC080065]|uniref:glycosyltransferase family 1 protein n=1 Tax=Heyndrickxia sp. NPDC080065 TaxID=3390568 RepID=UPI003CFCD08D